MTIKAIETRYKGYRFRSRLEARWAVFFEATGAKWEYEKEGYHIPNCGPYLPDFWLPELQCWVEIKPEIPTEEELNKVSGLAYLTGFAAVVAFGLPCENPLSVFCSECTDGGGGEGWWGDPTCGEAVQWAWAENGLCIDSANNWSSRVFSGLPVESGDDVICHSFPRMMLSSECDRRHHRIGHAATAARSARFEHGEKPA